MVVSLGDSQSAYEKEQVGEIRRTQLVTTFGPGAIVDMPSCSVIINDAKNWDMEWDEINENRLERLLGVKCFKRPKAKGRLEEKEGISASRFPSWHYCPSCKTFAPFWKLEGQKKGHCGVCSSAPQLVPSRFVVACVNGHIDDFPYQWWVHSKSEKKCSKKSALRIEFAEDTGGLDGIRITCRECGATRTMAGSMSSTALKGLKCDGSRPWLIGKSEKTKDPETCAATLRTLQRGASNVYFSVTASALTIPTNSVNKIEEVALRCRDFIEDYFEPFADKRELLDTPEQRAIMCELFLSREGSLERFSVEDILKHIQKIEDNGAIVTEDSLLEDEYRALCGPDAHGKIFETQHIDPPTKLARYVNDIVLVHRLREVMALKGFRRIHPDYSGQGDVAPEGLNPSRDYTPAYSGSENWLPATEMLGEGIFITLNPDELKRWEKSIGQRYSAMRNRLDSSNLRCDNFSSQYVLLHTIAHLLIRQLTFDCGYSGSALSEKIYSSTETGSMAGILIYTSSSDSDGSLGGLVRQGRPNNLLKLFEGMLASAAWCSSDPLCSEAKSQGNEGLNYAACHACALLPETSCRMRNSLLDRASVVGTLDDPSIGYFSSWNDISDSEDAYPCAQGGPMIFSADFGDPSLRRMSFSEACNNAIGRSASSAWSDLIRAIVEQASMQLETPGRDVEFCNDDGGDDETAFAALAWEGRRVALLDEESVKDFFEVFGDKWLSCSNWKFFIVGSCSADELIAALKDN